MSTQCQTATLTPTRVEALALQQAADTVCA
jgi:hypothetical protein